METNEQKPDENLIKSDAKDEKVQEQQNVPKVETKKTEQEIKKAEEDSLLLFTSYMQCFRNKTAEQIMNDPKYKELNKAHKFWDTQPVTKPTNLTMEQQGALEKKTVDEISKTKCKLPPNFEWIDFDLESEEQMKDLYTLLAENYVEDDDGCFRFDYSIAFLRWALMPPGYHKDMYFGIRDTKNANTLAGFISGIPVELHVEKSTIKTTEVNFLCVHKKYRSFSMASVLIKEVVRRSNLRKIWQGVYTSGTLLPTPFTQTRYYHRSLNPKKLIEARFTYANPKFSVSAYEKLNQLPDKPNIAQGSILRPTEERDIKQIRKMLIDFLSQNQIYQEYTKEEARHWFVHRTDVIESFVIEKNGKVTDFFCYYSLPSTILNNEKYKTLRAAYSYYFVNGSMTMKELYEVALIQAKKSGYDVFNALDVMNNSKVFDDLNFHGGDGYLNYYLYNWKLENPILTPGQIGFVLM